MKRFGIALALLGLPGVAVAQADPSVDVRDVAAPEAQAERQTGFMVLQMCVVPGDQMGDYNRLGATTTPILDALMEEGMLRAWYDLRHGWGDEWNVVFLTVTDSHRAWLDYFGEFVRRINEADPGLMAQFNTMCVMHKDNMYSVRDSRGSSG